MRCSLLVAVLVLPLVGCATASPVATTAGRPGELPAGGPVVTRAAPVPTPYDGPLDLPLTSDDRASVLERSGAAGRALQCAGVPFDGGGGRYDSGLASVQDHPAEALENYLIEEGLRFLVPAQDYRVERADEGRVLLSYDVEERTKVAFVAADDVQDFGGDVGWGVAAWAMCDPAELPPTVADALNIGVWVDEPGRRVPSSQVRVYQGAAHCDWQDITFLVLGPRAEADQYVRATRREFFGLLRTTYEDAATLPGDAVDTGYRRNGRELWLVPNKEAAYLVSVDDPSDVERWPAAEEYIACQ